MTSIIQKWGNSQGIRIPKSVMEEVNFKSGDCVELIVENGALIIKNPALQQEKRKSIRELFKDYHGDYVCEEIETE